MAPVRYRNRKTHHASSNALKSKDNFKNNNSSSSAPCVKQGIVRKAPQDFNVMYPSTGTVFKILLSARFCAAIWSIISDCDETFNYWEPSHFLIFGSGFKTWEYDVKYSLRSYSFISFFTFPVYLYEFFLKPNKVLLFYFVRCILAFSSAFCEVCLYKGVCWEFGVHVGRLMLIFLLFSPAMFISSTAFLPSSFSMHMTSVSFGLWYQRKYKGAILATACSALFSWPFAAVIGIPIALDMLFLKKKVVSFISWSAISVLVFVPMQIVIDAQFYNKFTFTQLNLIFYNIFSSHGPTLYGTEPWYFYIINCFLNFNIVFLAACFAPLGLLLVKLFVPCKSRDEGYLSVYLTILSFALWFGIFIAQPHKEERFLFPIYPLICLVGAIGLDTFQKLWFRFIVRSGTHYLKHTFYLWVPAVTVFILLGLSRIFALSRGYHAPIDTYMELSGIHADNAVNAPPGQTINVCVGKEWHRFPNSFFLPSDQWQLHFIKSEFKGQLPDKFEKDANGKPKPSAFVNDGNLEEPSRYVDPHICHFLVDLDNGVDSELEPNYSAHSDDWLIVKSVPFLNAAKSNRILRAFYIPFLWNSNEFGSYNLLASKKKFQSKAHSFSYRKKNG
ncbi:unnamed protein product [Bemisia tabaci]|uniref:Mannosyltransferase n=2 Tax=Bemisia tabaci TaxID=7038 RepID=A0A9P0A5Y4_BEMTA|nr:unnamed protein product [Bemisia tabaci]